MCGDEIGARKWSGGEQAKQQQNSETNFGVLKPSVFKKTTGREDLKMNKWGTSLYTVCSPDFKLSAACQEVTRFDLVPLHTMGLWCKKGSQVNQFPLLFGSPYKTQPQAKPDKGCHVSRKYHSGSVTRAFYGIWRRANKTTFSTRARQEFLTLATSAELQQNRLQSEKGNHHIGVSSSLVVVVHRRGEDPSARVGVASPVARACPESIEYGTRQFVTRIVILSTE
ncbi:hypothetical protein DFJ58DRAFT_914115 [Suillus subalutaceus]|uniref:uncharacterized protein n=1 Tax=Suillus subalutaceus TaxID=48586 RepID=UPI001B8828A3|nr:uncharacterized protein DFJ58DRAFT_914115 [Suillus subalutaceus]KAG1854208.1 hypothetical protein DFJ58DRAFT_914115 [Suillus subalutaceus]